MSFYRLKNHWAGDMHDYSSVNIHQILQSNIEFYQKPQLYVLVE